MQVRLTHFRKRTRLAEQKLKRVIEESIMKNGHTLNKELHDDFSTIIKEQSSKIDQTYPEGSFASLFWHEQLKAASLTDNRQMRWHPLIIRWCINMKLLSSAGYHATRTAGFIKLPSERTLHDYTHYFKLTAGYQKEVLKQLQEESQVDKLPCNKQFCGIIIDEMKIREGRPYF